MNARKERSGIASLGGIVHYLALLFVITPAADFIANVAPFQITDAHWRYGTIALWSGFMLTPMLGLVISTVAAELLGQVRLQRVLGFLTLGSGIALGLLLFLFGLDLIQVRHGVPDDARLTFDVGSMKALAKHLTIVPALVWLGLLNLRLAKQGAAGKARTSDGYLASRLKDPISTTQK